MNHKKFSFIDQFRLIVGRRHHHFRCLLLWCFPSLIFMTVFLHYFF